MDVVRFYLKKLADETGNGDLKKLIDEYDNEEYNILKMNDHAGSFKNLVKKEKDGNYGQTNK